VSARSLLRSPSRVRRRVPVLLVLAAVLSVGGQPAQAADQVRESGMPGAWNVLETPDSPATQCWYWEGLGSLPLEGIRLRRRVYLWGTSLDFQPVGMRPVLQQRIRGTWRVVTTGRVRTGTANLTTPAIMPRLTAMIPRGRGNGPYRLALDLLWYGPDARVSGERRVVVSWYIRNDGVPVHSCLAEVPGDPIGG